MGYLDGFKVTLSKLNHGSDTGAIATVKYPNVKRPKPERFHGRHVLNRYEDGMEKCIGCELCAGVCPAKCIYVRGADNDPDDIGAHRMELEHLVEAGGAVDLGRRAADELGDVLHGVLGEPPVLLLGEVAQRDRGALGAWVVADELAGALHVGGREPGHQRSTSPSTGSMEEMTATTSAIWAPISIVGMDWRFTKDGPRTCMRQGLEEPSATR